jgi:hypothetical protein
MRKVLLATALLAGLMSSASAQGVYDRLAPLGAAVAFLSWHFRVRRRTSAASTSMSMPALIDSS